MLHRIVMPDNQRGWVPRAIEWDPEARTLAGDHSCVEHLREMIDAVVEDGGVIGHVAGYWRLRDPWGDPADFLLVANLVLTDFCWDPAGLPAALRGVRMTGLTSFPLGPGQVA